MFTETLDLQVIVSGPPLAIEGLWTVFVTIILIRFCAAAISGSNPIQLLDKIITDQRTLLKDVFNTSDVTTIPQVWTLCECPWIILRCTYRLMPSLDCRQGG